MNLRLAVNCGNVERPETHPRPNTVLGLHDRRWYPLLLRLRHHRRLHNLLQQQRFRGWG